jgi:hypothetical protein
MLGKLGRPPRFGAWQTLHRRAPREGEPCDRPTGAGQQGRDIHATARPMPILGKEAVTGGVAEISAIMAELLATFQSNVGASSGRQLTGPGFGGRS